MQTDIYYRDITRTDNLEDYLLERVEKAAQEFFKYDDNAHVTVRVETDRHRSQTRKPSYLCEVIVKPSRTREVIKILKTDENFKTCVAKSVGALKAVLAKRSAKRSEHHRHDPVLEQEAPVPEVQEEWLAV